MLVRLRLWQSKGHAQCIPQSPALTIGGNVLKESDDLVILGVTFDSKMTYEKHLRSVSRAASQRLGILRMSWQVFHDRLLLGRCFRGFVLPVLEYCSAVWCSAADTHLRLLDCVVSGVSFLTVSLHIVDLWQYYVCCTRSGVTWCTLFMVLFLCRMCRCGLHVVLLSHIGTLMRLLAAEPLSIAGHLFPGQYLMHVERSYSDLVLDGVGLAGFKSRANAFLLA